MHLNKGVSAQPWSRWANKAAGVALAALLAASVGRSFFPLRAPQIAVEVLGCSPASASCAAGQMAQLRVMNRGEAVLWVYQARAACSVAVTWDGPCSPCTLPLEVPPGGEVRVNVQFPERPSDATERATLTLYSNDPRQPALTIEL